MALVGAVIAMAEIASATFVVSVLVVMLPIPIGAAVLRSVDFSGRQRVGRNATRTVLAMAGLSTLVVLGVSSGGQLLDVAITMPLSALLFVSVLSGDLLRQVGKRGLEAGRGTDDQRIEATIAQFSEFVQGSDESGDILGELVKIVSDELGARGIVAVDQEGTRRAGIGRGLSVEAREAMAKTIGDGRSRMWLSRQCVELGAPVEMLRREGVEFVVRLAGNRLSGLFLCVLGRNDWSQYSAADRTLVSGLAKLAAVGVDRAVLVERIRREEQLLTVGRVGASMMHDIGRRAGSISERAKTLVSRGKLDRNGQVSAVRIEAMALEIGECVDRVAQFAEGRVGECGAEVDLDELIDLAVLSTKHMHPRAEFSVHSTPGVTAFAGDLDLRLALVNVLDNAVRASTWGDVVTIRVELRADEVVIRVQDRGCGMSPRVVEHAFDAFWSTRADGNGLGLASVRGVVARMGGRVEVNSIQGVGSMVSLLFPKSALSRSVGHAGEERGISDSGTAGESASRDQARVGSSKLRP